MVSDRDKATRGAVLSVLEGILKREGEQEVWKQAGRLSDQQRSLIEERFKFVYKAEAKQDQSSSQSPSPRSLKSSRRESQNGQTEITPPSHQIPRYSQCLEVAILVLWNCSNFHLSGAENRVSRKIFKSVQKTFLPSWFPRIVWHWHRGKQRSKWQLLTIEFDL